MSVETHVHRARDAVDAEREAVDAKVDAFDHFQNHLADVEVDRPSARRRTAATAGGTLIRDRSRSADGCRTVRRAFAEIVRPHSVADIEESESVLVSIRAEFSESIALALAPATDTGLIPELKRSIRVEAQSRRREAATLRAVLAAEADELAEAVATIEEITDWIADADETPLSELGFEDLRRRHRVLTEHRNTCENLLADRQLFLDATTSVDGATGVRHRSVVEYCYDEFPVNYPVLSTSTRLIDLLESCQRTVRAHLVRRT